MGRRNFYQILNEKGISSIREYERLYGLFYTCPIQEANGNCYTLKDYVAWNFLDVPFRKTCLSIEDFDSTYGFHFVEKPYKVDLNYLLSFCEYTYNFVIWMSCESNLFRYGNRQQSQLYIDQVRRVIESIGYMPLIQGYVTTFVPKMPEAITVSEIVSPDISYKVLEYNHYTMKGGWSLNLPKTTIALDLEGGYGGNKRKGEMNYKETRSVAGGSPVTEDYRSIDDYDNDENIGLGSLAVQHKFNDKGHELSGSAYYKYGGHALEYFFNDLMSLEGQRQQGHRAYEAEHRETMRINLDYALPFGKGGKLEAGYQYYSYLEDGDYNMEWWDPKGQTFFWRDDIYNTFYFQEGVNSIYTILSHTWKNLEVQAGVRGEHTHTVLRSSVEGADRTKNRFEFFPSVHLGYTFPNEHRLLASYSRRTTRPQLFYMEPYITYRDFYTAEIGNPDIRPEYINSFELNYRKSFGENTVSATAFHRYRKDKIERLRVPYSAGVTLDSMANVGHDYSTGIELSVSLHPVRWWNTTVNGNVYHYKVKNEQAAGGNTTSSTNYDILWNNLFNLGKYTRIQLDGSFVGPSVTTQGRTDAYWYANVAVRQQLCNRKLTATLAFRDIFRSAKYISDIQTADLRSLTRIKPKYPQITLTLSWTFNSFKAKSTQAKEDRSEMFEGIKH